MGLLDTITSLAGGANGDHAKVLGGLMQAIESQPGGIQGVFKSFQENGLGDHATALANGQPATMSPDEVQQGLNGTGLIERTAEHAGVSPQIVQMALTTVLPLIMAHFASNPGAAGTGDTSTPAAEQGGFSGMAESMLKKFM
jgi:uncharacterized protein YidB (DUF937 family)